MTAAALAQDATSSKVLDSQAGALPVQGYLTPWPPKIGSAKLRLVVQPGSNGSFLRNTDFASVVLDMPGPNRMKPVQAILKRSGAEGQFEGEVSLTMAGRWRIFWVLETPSGDFRVVSTFQVESTGPVGTGSVPSPDDCGPIGPNELAPIALTPTKPLKSGTNTLRFQAPPGQYKKVFVAAQMSGMPLRVAPREASQVEQSYEVDLPLPMSGLWLVRIDLDGKVSKPTQILIPAREPKGFSSPLLVIALFSLLPLGVWTLTAKSKSLSWLPSLAIIVATLLACRVIEQYWPADSTMGMDMSQPEMGMAGLEAPIPVVPLKVQRLSLEVSEEYPALVRARRETLLKAPKGGLFVAESEAGKAATRGQILATVDHVPVTAPDRQVVTRYLIDSGQRVAAGDALIALADIKRVRVRAQVPLSHGSLFSVGQPVLVADGDGLVEGRLVELQATTEGDTFWIEAEVNNERPAITHMAMNDLPQPVRKPGDDGGRPGRLSLGQSVQLRYLSDRRNGVLAVPLSAIDEQTGKNYLYVIRDLAGLQVCQRRMVSLGVRNQTHIEIVSGLAEGETIAALSQEPLSDGSLVMTGEWGRGLFRNLLLPDDLGPSH